MKDGDGKLCCMSPIILLIDLCLRPAGTTETMIDHSSKRVKTFTSRMQNTKLDTSPASTLTFMALVDLYKHRTRPTTGLPISIGMLHSTNLVWTLIAVTSRDPISVSGLRSPASHPNYEKGAIQRLHTTDQTAEEQTWSCLQRRL